MEAAEQQRDVRLTRAVEFEALDETRLREITGEDMAQAVAAVHARLDMRG